MMNLKINHHSGSVVLVFFTLLFAGCVKELKPVVEAPVLKYLPFGEDRWINKVRNADANSLFLVMNNSSILKVEGEAVMPLWETEMGLHVNELIYNSNRELFVIQSGYNAGLNSLFVSKLDNQGKTVLPNSAGKLVTKYPALQEEYVAACGDGNNGIYILVYLSNNAPTPTQRRVLIHMNANGSIDQTTDLVGFYVYMQSDNQGNLYLIRTTSPAGTQMKLEALKVDMPYLKSNNNIKKVWSYLFTSNQADWKWTNYFPFRFYFYNERLYILKQHNTGLNDQSTGIDCIILNAVDRSLISEYTVPSDVSIDNYHDPISFYTVFTPTTNHLCFNYGEKAKIVKLDMAGNDLWHAYLSGTENRCKITGIGTIGSRNIVFGKSTLNKSPSHIPFYYFVN